MKKISLLLTGFVTALLVACGPAAENKDVMHARARVFQDSIANVIRMTLAEAEGPAAMPPVVNDTAAQRSNSIQGQPR